MLFILLVYASELCYAKLLDIIEEDLKLFVASLGPEWMNKKIWGS